MAPRRRRRRPGPNFSRRRPKRSAFPFVLLVGLLGAIWVAVYLWEPPLPLRSVPRQTPDSPAVATWRDGTVTEGEFLRALQRELYGEVVQPAEADAEIRRLLREFTDAESREILRELAAREVLFFSPGGREYRESPDFRLHFLLDEQKRHAHWMVDNILAHLPAPTEEEMRAYVEEQREQFEQPEVFLARQLFVNIDLYGPPAEKRTPETAREVAEELRRRVERGEDFVQLIAEHSESPSRKRDGLVGPFQPGQVLGAFENLVRRLEVGEVAKPLALEDGYTIVQLVSRKAAGLPDLDVIREEVEAALAEERFALAMEEALTQAETLATVRFDAAATLTGGRNERALYRVGDFGMTLGDLWTWYQDLPPVVRDHYTRTTGVPDTEALREFVEESYEEALLAALAAERGLPEIERDRALRSDRLILDVATVLLENRVDALLDDMAQDTEQVRAFYENDPLRFQNAPEILLDSVRLEVAVEDPSDRRAQFRAEVKAHENAEDLYQALATGADLKELRDHPAAPAITEERVLLSDLDPALQQEVAALDLESATFPVLLPPLRTSDAWVVARVLDGEPGRVPPFEEVGPQVAEAFRSEMLPEAERQVIDSILNEAGFVSRLEPWLAEHRTEAHVEITDGRTSL